MLQLLFGGRWLQSCCVSLRFCHSSHMPHDRALPRGALRGAVLEGLVGADLPESSRDIAA